MAVWHPHRLTRPILKLIKNAHRLDDDVAERGWPDELVLQIARDSTKTAEEALAVTLRLQSRLTYRQLSRLTMSDLVDTDGDGLQVRVGPRRLCRGEQQSYRYIPMGIADLVRAHLRGRRQRQRARVFQEPVRPRNLEFAVLRHCLPRRIACCETAWLVLSLAGAPIMFRPGKEVRHGA